MISLAVYLALTSATALAAGRPVITESIDEPGRNFYQEGIFTGCAFAGDCAILFTPVPVGTRRVVDHLSCFVSTSAVTSVPFVTLGNQNFRNARNFIPLAGDGSGTTFFNDAATLAFYDAGEIPRIDIFVNAALPNTFLCTLAGHDIQLP
jgi:hypothetical protein